SPLASSERGGAVGLGGRGARVEAAVVDRTGRDAGTVRSLRGTASPLHGATVEAEVASGGGGTARMAKVEVARPTVSLGARHLDADAAFPGRERGVREDAASLWLRPAGALRLEAAFLRRMGGTAFVGPAALRPGLRQTVRLGVGWRSLFSLRWTDESRSGELFTGPYDRAAQTLTAEGTLRTGLAWLHPAVEAGTATDRRTGEREPYRRVSLQAGAATRQGSSLALSVRRQDGRGANPVAPQQGWTGGVDGALRLGGATLLRVSAQSSRLATGGTGGLVDVSVEQGLPLGQRVVARSRTGIGADAPGSPRGQQTVDYVIPVSVPVARARQAGRATGRVYDAETGRGIGGAVVRVGGRAVVTDASGRWAVTGLADGEHAVEPDRLAVGLDRVPATAAPSTVRTGAREEGRLDLALVRGARVSGTLLGMGSGDAGTSAGSGANAVVVLTGEGATLRRPTDAAGRFEFADLRPGRWRLSVDAATLPAYRVVQGDTAAIDLAPGAARQVELRVVERQRPMQIVAEAEVVLGAPRPAPAQVAAAEPAARPRRNREPPAPKPAETRRAPAEERIAAAVDEAPEAAVEYDDLIGTYPVAAGDRDLTAIAWLVYTDGTLWPRIWLANRDVLPDPDRLTPGIVLRIPAPGPLTAAEHDALRRYQERRRP
ncbi:MAG: hypothetical protein JWM27_2696, partial [Gemmatimonadetes bacterium]|nr:hypothetical protein [Gemmatimonadota bacterium]